MALPDDSGDSRSAYSGEFVTTHWSVVARAGQADAMAREPALDELCRNYWYPIYAYIRRLGRSPHDAEDLTQGFFAKLLDKNFVAAAEREKGKFRTFLLTAVKRFLANEWDREHAQKRGGFQPLLSIDQELAEARLHSEPGSQLSPDLLFDQRWASTLLERVMDRLQEEYTSTGRGTLFTELRSRIVPDRLSSSYAQAAAQLAISEAAFKMAVQRFRARYRQLLRQEIGQTVSDPEEVEAEIRHLFATFGARGTG